MGQISTTTIGYIVIGIVVLFTFAIGMLAFILRKRKVDRTSRIMITMAGTTVVNNNGSRQFQEAGWVPAVGSAPSSAPNSRRGSMVGLPAGVENFAGNNALDIERFATPRAVKRASYMSAKRLEIPSVLTEDFDAEKAASEESASGTCTAGTTPNVSSLTVVSEKTPAIYIQAESSQSGSSGFEHDVDIDRILKGTPAGGEV